MKKFYLILLLFITIHFFAINSIMAQHSHADEHDEAGHHSGLHFVHPLFTESVSPDTKVRLDYQFQNPELTSELELEGEYTFSRIFSIEAGIHFNPESARLGNTHILFKLANYALEERNVLLGYGLSLDLPTGASHEHGAEESNPEDPADHHHEENIYQLSPFFNAGIKAGKLELVGWTLFHIPTNQAHPEEATTTFEYNISTLYHFTSRIQPLMELTGRQLLSGHATGGNPLYVAPGLRVKFFENTPLVIGLSMRIPVTEARDFDTQSQISVLFHF